MGGWSLCCWHCLVSITPPPSPAAHAASRCPVICPSHLPHHSLYSSSLPPCPHPAFGALFLPFPLPRRPHATGNDQPLPPVVPSSRSLWLVIRIEINLLNEKVRISSSVSVVRKCREAPLPFDSRAGRQACSGPRRQARHGPLHIVVKFPIYLYDALIRNY